MGFKILGESLILIVEHEHVSKICLDKLVKISYNIY